MMKEAFLMNEIIRKNVEEDYKRVNNDMWICNQLEDLVVKYEKCLRSDDGKDLSDTELGEHNNLLAVVQDLKELLYIPD